MTDDLEYTAKIRAKGLASTGVTEEVARRLYGRRGSHVMLIVEAKVAETHDRADGAHRVDLTVEQVEPANDPKVDEHLRELTRALHGQRRLHDEDDQPQIDGLDDIEPTVAQVMARGVPLPLPDEQGDDQDDAADDDWSYPAPEGQQQEQPVST